MRLFVLSFMSIALANCAPAPESFKEPLIDVELSNTAVPEIGDDHTRLDEIPPEERADEEGLDIVVIGTFAGEKGSAILSVSDEKQATYRVGDQVLPEVYLKAVDKNFIVLDVRGEAKRLPLNNQRLSQASTAAPDGYSFKVEGNNFRPPFKVLATGQVVDRDGTAIGRVDSQGRIIDIEGRIIGRLKQNQQ